MSTLHNLVTKQHQQITAMTTNEANCLADDLGRQPELLKSQATKKYESTMKILKQIHTDIDQRFCKLDTLKGQYSGIKQRKFIKAFIGIMDKMSSELQQANEAYDCIDKEINQDPKCRYLHQQLHFFQGECLNTKAHLTQKMQMLHHQTKKYQSLMKQREQLQAILANQTHKDLKYKSKAKSLHQSERQSSYRILSHRNSVNFEKRSRQKNFGLRNYSLQHGFSQKRQKNAVSLKQQISMGGGSTSKGKELGKTFL